MEATWKDDTTYSRDDKDRIPSVWTLKTAKLQITVVKGHRFNPENWIFHCRELNFDTKPLGKLEDLTLEEAQAKAISIVKATLVNMFQSLK